MYIILHIYCLKNIFSPDPLYNVHNLKRYFSFRYNVNYLYNEMMIRVDDQAQKYLFIRSEISRNVLIVGC